MLIVDDDDILRERLARAFRDRGFEVRTASNYDEAMISATSESPEMAVIDFRMPGKNGLELAKELRAIDQHTRIVVLTGYGSVVTSASAPRLGATYYLPKPVDADDILAVFYREKAPHLEASESYSFPHPWTLGQRPR